MKEKILVLSSSYPQKAGDSNGNFIHELNCKLSAYYDIYVISPWEKGLSKNEKINNITIYRHKQFPLINIKLAYGIGIYEKIKANKFNYFVIPFFLLYQILMIRKVIKKEKISFIHCHWIIPNAFTACVYKALINSKVKLIATAWGSDLFAFSGKIGSVIKKIILNKIDLLFTQGEPLKKRAIELGYRMPINSLPCGVNSKMFSPEKYRKEVKNAINPDGPIILFVGICVEAKGIGYLLESMVKIAAEFPLVKLLLVGDDSKAGSYKNFIVEKKLDRNIYFYGSTTRDKLPELFACSDIFILPSLSEGWPLVVMEAMSSGLVCIVSDLPVFTENPDYKNLLVIVRKKNANDIYYAINNILNKNKNYEMIKKQAREFAVKNFDWGAIAYKYMKSLKEISL